MSDTTSTGIDWGQFSSGFEKFTEPGQVIEGVVVGLGLGNYQGKEYPEVTFRKVDGSVVVFSATQTMLKRKLAELMPKPGDSLRIRYDGQSETSKPGQHPAKLFTVDIVRQDAAALLGAEELV